MTTRARSTHRTTGDPLKAQRSALLQLKSEYGLTDKQLARVAHIDTGTVQCLRAGWARAKTKRERVLVEMEGAYVRDLVAQQEAIKLLLRHNIRRSDLAYACDATLEALRFWEGGRAQVIRRADGVRRDRLFETVKRAKRIIRDRPNIDFSNPKNAALLKMVLGKSRPEQRPTGRISKEKTLQLQMRMRKAGFWPPRIRAAKLGRLISEGGISKSEWMRRMRVSRRLFYDLLNPAKETVVTPDVIKFLAKEYRKLESAKITFSLSERFLKAMTTLLGKERIETGFRTGAPELPDVLRKLQSAMNWKSERNVRRYLPPYTKVWWKERNLLVKTVEKFERAAKRLGNILPERAAADGEESHS